MSILTKIFKQPKLAYYYGQRSIRNPALRRFCANIYCRWLNITNRQYFGLPDQSWLHALNTEGVVFLEPLYFSRNDLDQISEHFQGKSLFDFYTNKELGPIESVTCNQQKAQYSTKDCISCKVLTEFANHPKLLATVKGYLGATPSIASVQAWWTFGENHDSKTDLSDDIYHRDVDDLKFIKLFVYLTDTGLSNGAHSFIKKSHLSRAFTARGAISDAQAKAQFSAVDFLTVTGNAGTAFLEDTWGIHRPLTATTGRRLIFSVLYSLSPWVPQGCPEPLMPLPQGLDPFVNRTHFF